MVVDGRYHLEVLRCFKYVLWVIMLVKNIEGRNWYENVLMVLFNTLEQINIENRTINRSMNIVLGCVSYLMMTGILFKEDVMKPQVVNTCTLFYMQFLGIFCLVRYLITLELIKLLSMLG